MLMLLVFTWAAVHDRVKREIREDGSTDAGEGVYVGTLRKTYSVDNKTSSQESAHQSIEVSSGYCW